MHRWTSHLAHHVVIFFCPCISSFHSNVFSYMHALHSTSWLQSSMENAFQLDVTLSVQESSQQFCEGGWRVMPSDLRVAGGTSHKFVFSPVNSCTILPTRHRAVVRLSENSVYIHLCCYSTVPWCAAYEGQMWWHLLAYVVLHIYGFQLSRCFRFVLTVPVAIVFLASRSWNNCGDE